MQYCPFCSIINQESPAYIVYENDKTLVLLDKAMDVDYHMLAIPKIHVKNILDCPPQILADLMETVKELSTYCTDSLGFNGVNILSAANDAAGQSVSHFHIHIIPRKSDDQINAWPTFPGATIDLSQAYQFLKR